MKKKKAKSRGVNRALAGLNLWSVRMSFHGADDNYWITTLADDCHKAVSTAKRIAREERGARPCKVLEVKNCGSLDA